MAEDESSEPTRLIERWQAGDDAARARLIALLYDEMREIARRLMRTERSDHTLQPTAVVHEACVRLLGVAQGPARTRNEFLGLAARVMRQVLVEHARSKGAGKRGSDWKRVSISHREPNEDRTAGLIDALDLDEALGRLAKLSERQARVAELRYFGGMTVGEAADALGVSPSLVHAEWAVARLWLAAELRRRNEE